MSNPLKSTVVAKCAGCKKPLGTNEFYFCTPCDDAEVASAGQAREDGKDEQSDTKHTLTSCECGDPYCCYEKVTVVMRG